LAHWALSRLVNRADAWGTYSPQERRGLEYRRRDGILAVVPVNYTAKGVLTAGLLARHFRGRCAEHILGLHTTSTDNRSRWGAVDIDQHGDQSPDPAKNLAAALAWYDELVRHGFMPLLTDSNGRGGYHLRVIFGEPAPTPQVFSLMRWLVRDYADHGLTAPPETFPKQARIDPDRFGNWLRLPGRHHTRPHWSRIRDGTAWLDGAEAVAHLLTVTGDSPKLMPPAAKDNERPAVLVSVRFVPAHPPRRGTSLERRIRGYMAKLPNLSEGQGRDNVGYSFACWLLRDLGLSDDAALSWLEEWDRRNSPPKGTQRLLEIMGSARRYGQHPIACATGGYAS
jgi:hypothetical protein